MLRYSLTQLKTGADGSVHDEHQYASVVRWVLDHGRREVGRNGPVLADTGASMHYSLENGTLPLFTTKRVAWKACLGELLWFLKGDTDSKRLAASGVHIWDGNGSREFLDSRGLSDHREGDLGPVYGHQWRHFNAPYEGADADYGNKGVDQLQAVVDALSDPAQRTSRRIVMSAWNPSQIPEMALPPCHILAQFHVRDGKKLSCSLYQRSADLALGVPFNVASYATLTHLLASQCGLEAEELVHHLGHCHVYEGHEPGLRAQLERTPKEFPKLVLHGVDKGRPIDGYTVDNFELVAYDPHPRIKFDFCA